MKWLRSKRVFQLLLILLLPLVTRAQDNSPFNQKQLKGVDTSTRRELSDEEIQAQFFKKSGAEKVVPATVFMPVFYERMERALGKIETTVTPGPGPMQLDVDVRALQVILRELVVEEWMKKLTARQESCDGKPKCMAPLSVFDDPDVKIKFDESALELRILIPPELRSPKTSSLFKVDAGALDEATDQHSFLSSFINVNVDQSFRSDATELKGGREAVNASLDSGTRIGRLVIDARGHYTEERKEIPTDNPAFMRQDVRAIMDFEKSAIRVQAGDLAYPVTGFQIYKPMAGVAMFSQYTLQPSYLTQPSGSYELFLSQPSKISVFVNERLVQVLTLPAGRHNLRDFPFASGLNDLRLEITDDTGRTETKTYSYFSNNTLLKPGLNEISYAVGSPSEDIAGERKYDSKNTIVSASHRIGVTQSLTLGANVQRDPTQTVVGLDTLFSTKIGFFSLEPAYSTAEGQPSGYAGKFRYINQNYVGKERRSRFYALELNTYSDNFAEFGTIRLSENPIAFKAIATHSRSLDQITTINFNISYQLNRMPQSELTRSFGISAGLNRRWNKGLSSSLNFQHRQNVRGEEDLSLMAYLVWSIPDERQSITASHDTSTGSSRADWSYQPLSGAEGLAAQANLQDKDTERSYGGMLDYTANRARANVTHQVVFPETKDDPNQAVPTKKKSFNITSFRFGTALVFAGGHFAISRPVTDSFAILAPLENLDGQNVRLNAQNNGAYLAQTDWLGSAVHPELPSYSFSSIAIDSKSLKPGTSMPRDNFLLKPPYHSGYAIQIGSDATVYLSTKLENPDGTPAAMLAAQAHYLDDESKEPVMVFTNRSGLLRSEGFRTGRYRLEVLEGGAYDPIEFEIPKSAKGEFKMEVLKLKAKSP